MDQVLLGVGICLLDPPGLGISFVVDESVHKLVGIGFCLYFRYNICRDLSVISKMVCIYIFMIAVDRSRCDQASCSLLGSPL